MGGGVAGALAPVGFGASVAALGGGALAIGGTAALGVGGAYLGMAAANRTWDPTQFAWDRPGTWSGGFQGFVAVSSIAGIAGAWGSVYSGLGTVGRGVLIGSSVTGGLGLGYLSGASANGTWNPAKWDWSNPGTIVGIGFGVYGGFALPLAFHGAAQWVKGVEPILGFGSGMASTFGGTAGAWQTFGRVATMTLAAGAGTYLFGSAINNSWTTWDMSAPHTYEGMIGGFVFGMSAPGLPKAFKEGTKMLEGLRSHIKNVKLLKTFVEKYKTNFHHDDMRQAGIVHGRRTATMAAVVEMSDGRRYFAVSGRGTGCFAIYDSRKGWIRFTFDSNDIYLPRSLQKDIGLCPQVEPHWGFTNCAEPHAIAEALFSGHSRCASFDVTNIKSMTTIRVSNEILAPRCGNCCISTAAVAHVTSEANYFPNMLRQLDLVIPVMPNLFNPIGNNRSFVLQFNRRNDSDSTAINQGIYQTSFTPQFNANIENNRERNRSPSIRSSITDSHLIVRNSLS